MKQKLKPDLDLESIQADLIETVCGMYTPGTSVRSIAKDMEMSPMKVRKILITGGVYSTDLSTEIGELWKDGKTPGEIAVLLNTTVSNVNSYLPYERIIYGMEERSVEADRQQRYRDRKKAGTEEPKADTELPEVEKKTIERVRNKTMIIVIGKKLRRLLPADVLDGGTDPLSREAATWGSNIGGSFEMHEPEDPDRYIWCAEVTTSGRGKDKKQGIVLMSANCGFTVISPLPAFSPSNPDHPTYQELQEYRVVLEETIITAIRKGMLGFKVDEMRVDDYIGSVGRVELIKGRPSTPARRVEELIEQLLTWEKGENPLEHFNVMGNATTRKFGFSGFYRHVDSALFNMLGVTREEQMEWLNKVYGNMRV